MNEIDVSKCPFFRTMEQCDYKQLQRAIKQIADYEMLQCDMRETIDNLKGEIAGLQSLNDFNVQKIEVLEDKIERINETAHWSMDEVDSGLKNILRNIQEICND